MKKNLQILGFLFSILFSVSISAQIKYRTAGSGDWSNLATWEKQITPGMWAAATSLPPANATIDILAGHAINIDVNVIIDQGTINNFSTLPVTFTGANKLFIGNGGFGAYYNKVGAAMPVATNMKWDPTSGACYIEGVTTETSIANVSQNYGSFTYNCPNQTSQMDLDLADGTSISVFKILKTGGLGGGYVTLTTASPTPKTLTFDVFEVSDLCKTADGGSGVGALNIEINIFLTIKTNGFLFMGGITSPIYWRLRGSFVGSGGTLKGTPDISLEFDGGNTPGTGLSYQNFSRSSTTAFDYVNIIVKSGSTLQMAANIIFDESGNFTLEAGATLVCGHANGIPGSLQNTGQKNLSSAANYAFLGNGFNQNMGIFVTTPTPNTVNDLEMRSITGSPISLTGNLNVTNKLILNSGRLQINNSNLTVLGTIDGGSSSSFVSTSSISTGELTITNFTGTRTFPIGAGSSYDPLSITTTTPTTFKAKVGLNFSHPIAATNANTYFPREYNITPSTPTTADITLFPNASSRPSYLGGAVVGHWNGTAWEELAATRNNVTNGFTTLGVTNFSPFAAGAAGAFATTLAVEMKSISAKAVGAKNVINWETASEKDMTDFSVERSTNGFENWSKIGSVKAKGQSANVYDFNDDAPLSVGYYRVRSVDLAGKEDISKVVSVTQKGSKSDKMTLFPNPTKGNIAIQIEGQAGENVTISITSSIGQSLIQKNITLQRGSNTTDLNIADLQNGVYFMTLINGSEKTVQRIVKQN